MDGLKNKYLLKKPSDSNYTDVTDLFDGIRILSVTGMNARGKAVNVYNEQWTDSQVEDFMITSSDGRVVYENKDIVVTFVVGNKYADSDIDVSAMHDNFIDYMTSGDLYLKSTYTGLIAHCVCLSDYEPTTIKLRRGDASYMLGEITLHQLELPTRF